MAASDVGAFVFAIAGALLVARPAVAAPGSERDIQAAASGEHGKIMELIRGIDSRLESSKYSHATRVDETRGNYEFDCSGMVTWVLHRSAKVAHSTVLGRTNGARPLARDFYDLIAAVKPGQKRYGWSRVARVSEAEPGDVIAWIKPPIIRSPSTGHVAFVVEPAHALDGIDNAYLLRVADASQYQHQDDSRTESGRTGFGFGTILVVADAESGGPVAYGWVGAQSRWVLPAQMAIGRPLR